MDELISIITPSYNQADFIDDTIQSVLGQNYPNLEYIIIDGGSTDGSVEIIKKYEEKITHWVSETDGGQSEAINKGVAVATGEWIGWINSDDMLVDGALNAVSEAIQEASLESEMRASYALSTSYHNSFSRSSVIISYWILNLSKLL